MYKYDVTLLIVTYNPDVDSLLATLLSCIRQKDVKKEIVIADDCSKEFPLEAIEKCFENEQFFDYQIVRLKSNQGTVKNTLNGVNHAKGEYIKDISPGDLLYDDHVIRDFLDNANGNDALFGNSVYYSYLDNEIKVYPGLFYPKNIKPYLDNSDIKYPFLIMRDVILALSYFLKTDVYKKYLEKIQDAAKFAEDTLFMLMVADGVKPIYYDRNIVWYEYGGGISTVKNSKWELIIKEDYRKVGKILVKEHPEWKLFDDMNEKKLTIRVIYHILKRRRYFKKKYKSYISYDVEELKRYF